MDHPVHGELNLKHHIEVRFVVTVPRFSELRDATAVGAGFYTPSVHVAFQSFRLWIVPKAEGKEECVGMYLCPMESGEATVYGSLIEVIKANCAASCVREMVCPPHVLDEETRPAGFGAHTLIEFNTLRDDGFLSDASLHLRVYITFMRGRNAHLCPMPGEDDHVAYALQDEMSDLFAEGTDSDMIIVTRGVEWKVHRAIISHRSPVFRNMLGANMTETKSRRVEIPDFEPQVVLQFLHFLYAGFLQDKALNSLETMGALLKMADKYDVSSLLLECKRCLTMMLTRESVLHVMAVAHEIGQHDLQMTAMKFATRDTAFFQEVVDSREFDLLEPGLARELLIFSTGFGRKRRREGAGAEALEFPDGTDWTRLSYTQLQRACDERWLWTVGQRRELELRLESNEGGSCSHGPS